MAEREINGTLFTCEMLPAEQGLDLLMRFMRVAGPAAGVLEAAIRDGANVDVLRELAGFMARADSEAVGKLVLDLAKVCKRDGEPAQAANLAELLKLAAFALEAQFGDFFGEHLAGMITREAGAAADQRLSRLAKARSEPSRRT